MDRMTQTAQAETAVAPDATRTRRSLLAGAAAASVAAIASAAGAQPVRAANGETVTVGGTYDATAATTIQAGASGAPAIVGTSNANVGVAGSSGSQAGVYGSSSSGAGVIGQSVSSDGVSGSSTSANGVSGYSSYDVGVYGHTDSGGGYGVFGDSINNSAGVCGVSYSGAGVIGYVGTRAVQPGVSAETGVWGIAEASAQSVAVRGSSDSGTGVLAESNSGAALKVSGKAQFSRSGRKTISAGKSSLKVPMAGVTTASYVVATLQTKRTGVYVIAAVPAAGSLTIYLNKAVPATTAIGYLVIN
jgi:hypothetical protein